MDFVKKKGGGVRINTKRRSTFFEKKVIAKNNLWVESTLIVKIFEEKITIQYLCSDILYIKEVYLPNVYKEILFH